MCLAVSERKFDVMDIDSDAKAEEKPEIEKMKEIMSVDNDNDKLLLSQGVWRNKSKSKKESEMKQKIALDKKVCDLNIIFAIRISRFPCAN